MHADFMRLALDSAARGRGRVSPNPMVGAVVVRAGRVVGRGFYRRYGGPHAEVEALRAAGRAARGATVYVTLEPCCFRGKTGACTEALLRAGVARVFAATLDPHPRVNGRGVRCLRRAGIECRVGLLGAAARQLNEAYFTYHRLHRPFVVLKLAATLDGMLAAPGGESRWITGPVARRRAQELRGAADAVLVGVNTVLRDDPRLTCRVLPRKRLLRVVLDSRLRTGTGARLLRSRDPVLVLTSAAGAKRAGSLARPGVDVRVVRRGSDGLLRWPDVLRELCRREVQSLLVEGGATVASSALDAGIVDRVCVFQAPKILGPGLGFSQRMSGRSLGAAIRLEGVRHEVLGRDVLTEGRVSRD